jgi:hypothetical protein
MRKEGTVTSMVNILISIKMLFFVPIFLVCLLFFILAGFLMVSRSSVWISVAGFVPVFFACY